MLKIWENRKLDEIDCDKNEEIKVDEAKTDKEVIHFIKNYVRTNWKIHENVS